MYHSVIGKRLVAGLNERDGTNLTVREFYERVYVPLFFGSGRLLQLVNNSPFDQAIGKQKKAVTADLLAACIGQVHMKAQGSAPDASFYIGGPAAGVAETTSGQVTGMRVPTDEEDVYASWVGAALGITVHGGLTLLVDDAEVLAETYDGWRRYRSLLDDTPNLKPLQVNTWNGQWVTSRLNGDFAFYPRLDKEAGSIETQTWVQLLFALANHFRGSPARQLLCYVYALGQSNTTVGFVRLDLPEIRRPFDLYRRLYTVPDGLEPKAFESLYQTDLAFRKACEHVSIGLRALRPIDSFRGSHEIPKPPGSEPDKRLAFQTYETWIIAMLNNKELAGRADDLAKALYAVSAAGERGKTRKPESVKAVLNKKSRREFIEALTELINDGAGCADVFTQTVEDLLGLSNENVSLFLTLVRFRYAVASARA
jgi:hypothetical protein